MSQTFNPYREWLAVTSANSSPNYYELLGLPLLESDMAKINAAYQRQSGRLAAHLSGNQVDVAQRLMGELAEARMTLLTPTAKRAYDQTLAARGSGASTGASTQPEVPSRPDVEDMLPPAATGNAAPQATNVPAAAPASPAYSYPAGYVAPQAQPVAQGYPAQGYGTWQPQPVAAASPYAAAGYNAPPQATAVEPAPVQHVDAAPTIYRRPARRRSSPAPALLGVAIVVAAVVGGLWYHFQGNKTVAVVQPSDSTSGKSDTTSAADRQVDRNPPRQHNSSAKNDDLPTLEVKTQSEPPSIDTPATDTRRSDMPATDKPEPEATKPEPDKPKADAPPEKPTREPKPVDTKADAEEAVAVDKALKAVRTALGNRDLVKAKDLLDEATIEASASDSLAAVKRVETLMSYVEMFWDAARKTLPKLQAAETIEIDGKMVAVVEADEDHAVVRIEGRNREYTWQKLPPKLAYYLADRWLAKDEPIRNLVLASFQIVEPKGDRNQAESLLDAARAAGLDAEPLKDELKAMRGAS